MPLTSSDTPCQSQLRHCCLQDESGTPHGPHCTLGCSHPIPNPSASHYPTTAPFTVVVMWEWVCFPRQTGGFLRAGPKSLW